MHKIFTQPAKTASSGTSSAALLAAIIKNKVFFFAGEQATIQRSTPTANRSFVPTAKMLAGDFTDFAAPLCQSGKDVTLKGPFGTNGFAKNTVDPKLFSPIALTLVNDPR